MNCNDERLRSLLTTDEDSRDYQTAIAHLDQCKYCQSRIEELAAHTSVWQESQAILVSSNASRTGRNVPGIDETEERPWHRSHWLPRSTAWTESMAKQLLSAPSHPELLGRIGRYEVERLIGSGGMGIVFKAFDTDLNRPVAVKMLAPHLAANGSARQRFAREARAAAAVVHEHVVAIHNVETSGTSPFLVMQYVAGESLQQRIDREGPLELKEILRIATQTASGLAAAHAQGLVHRDVKPANIMLEQGVERTLLTDFGLARAVDDASLTHTGYHPGTPQYMSPEQVRGESVDARSDLFSLGSVIYTMCTGRPPFRAESTYGVLRRITDNEPHAMREISPHVPQWLETMVAKLHAKMPDQRYTSAEEVCRLLERCLAHVQQPTTVALPDSCRSTQRDGNVIAKLWTPRTRLAAGLLAIAFAVVFAIVGRGFFLDTPKAEMGTDVPEFTATEGASSSPSAVPTKDSSQEPSESWNANTPLITAFRDELESLEVRSRQVLLNPKLDTKDRQ